MMVSIAHGRYVDRSYHPRLSHRTGFLVAGAALGITMAFSTLPTPLYALYQRRLGISSFTITIIFAAFAAGVVASLSVAGYLSARYGRRAVLVPAIGLEALASALFLGGPSLTGLIVARALCGIGVGLVVATATAYLSELHAAARRHRREPGSSPATAERIAIAANMGGLGLGPLASGLIARYGAGPLRTPYVVFLVLLAASAIAMSLVPETSPATGRFPVTRTVQARLPGGRRLAGGRHAAAGAAFLAFAVFGMFTSLAPSFLSDELGGASPAAAGFVAFAVFGAAAVGQLLLAMAGRRSQVMVGLAALAGGLVAVTVGVWLGSVPLFIAAGAVTGAGAGALVKGSLSTVSAATAPHARGEAIAGLFLAAYAGLTLPVLALGAAARLVAVNAALAGFAMAALIAIGAVGPHLLRGSPRAVGPAA